jgi:hypothetical protein
MPQDADRPQAGSARELEHTASGMQVIDSGLEASHPLAPFDVRSGDKVS